MAVKDNLPPTPPPSSTDKIIPFNIPNKVPIKLDLENTTTTLEALFPLFTLVVSISNPMWKPTPRPLTRNDVNLMISSRCGSLDPYVIPFKNKSVPHRIGKMTVNEYCTKIESMAGRLTKLGCVVSDKNLAIYAVNGLDSRSATLVEIIHHRETLPFFEASRTMLLLKESSFNDKSMASTTFESIPSSPTVLMASNSSTNKGDLYTLTKPSTSPTALLSTNASTWHQRLGHPGDEGIVKPLERLSLNAFSISPIPKNPSDALKYPQWHNAMYDEYNALIKNST
ncbi:hypothetical protein Tco_0893541 [Tanacetum coccineum]|uniref:GAG-pre-integrase domain-containing protein n=1 Tax=Tanacetum coccineum TaxID=301880 RepID=A0ABQ5CFF6_9ASTR